MSMRYECAAHCWLSNVWPCPQCSATVIPGPATGAFDISLELKPPPPIAEGVYTKFKMVRLKQRTTVSTTEMVDGHLYFATVEYREDGRMTKKTLNIADEQLAQSIAGPLDKPSGQCHTSDMHSAQQVMNLAASWVAESVQQLWPRAGVVDPNARCEELLAAVENLAEDARRYRQYIRYNVSAGPSTVGSPNTFRLKLPPCPPNVMRGSVAQHLDAAIDNELKDRP